MHARVDKSKENKSQAVDNSENQKRGSGGQGFAFVDNRPEAIAQRRLQEMADNSPQAKQLKVLQQMVHNHADRQQQPIPKREGETILAESFVSGIGTGTVPCVKHRRKSVRTPRWAA